MLEQFPHTQRATRKTLEFIVLLRYIYHTSFPIRTRQRCVEQKREHSRYVREVSKGLSLRKFVHKYDAYFPNSARAL
jgi:hypothetical protein